MADTLSELVYEPQNSYWFATFAVFLLVMAVVGAAEAPLVWGFRAVPGSSWWALAWVGDALFFLNVLLGPFKAHVDKHTLLLVRDVRRTAWRYLKTYFLIDVVSCASRPSHHDVASPRARRPKNVRRSPRLVGAAGRDARLPVDLLSRRPRPRHRPAQVVVRATRADDRGVGGVRASRPPLRVLRLLGPRPRVRLLAHRDQGRRRPLRRRELVDRRERRPASRVASRPQMALLSHAGVDPSIEGPHEEGALVRPVDGRARPRTRVP